MHATLLAQPPTWARFTLARCALSPTASDGCQQRRVMPTFGSCMIGCALFPHALSIDATAAILQEATEKGRTDMQNRVDRITIDPNLAFGKPTIRNLRYSVQWLLELLSSGMTHQEILDDYEDLEMEDIYAVLAYAAQLAQVKRMIVVTA
jgi:uncharacterized protein (DUF433 family)